MVGMAFKEPLKMTEMLRFSFVIWNNQNKGKYGKDLMKDLTAALREIGYQDDKGASEDFACGGSYKYQHDTGLNIKVIHVYPRAEQVGGDSGAGAGAGGGVVDSDEEEQTVNIEDMAPDYLCTIVEMDSFQKMVSTKTQSWRQKKALLKDLQGMRTNFDNFVQKLIKMEPL